MTETNHFPPLTFVLILPISCSSASITCPEPAEGAVKKIGLPFPTSSFVIRALFQGVWQVDSQVAHDDDFRIRSKKPRFVENVRKRSPARTETFPIAKGRESGNTIAFSSKKPTVTSMDEGDWRNRVVSDADIHHGEPCIRGTRISVAVIVASLADLSIDDLLSEFPQLTREDVKAALLYAAESAHNTMVA